MNSFKAKVESVELENPNLQIATVKNQRNDVVALVSFERAFLISAEDVINTTSPSNDLSVGNSAAIAIERAARAQGVNKVLMVLSANHPPYPGERVIRVVEHTIQAAPTKQIRIGCAESPTQALLN